MLGLLICSMALCGDGANSPLSEADQASYRTARAAAGRSAEAQVKLSLWCEAHGMDAERLEHLATAVLIDPGHSVARGLLGLMPDGDRWRRPDDVAERAGRDAKLSIALAEYAARRERAARTADAQWNLAVWCEENKLAPEAQAHFGEVVRLDPSRAAAWKRLGCKKVGGRWTNDAQVAADKADREAQKAADKVWKPRLEKIRDDLRSPRTRADADAALASVADPRALPSVIRIFARDIRRMIGILGQIDSRRASRVLAELSVFADSEEDRRVATEILRQRDPREYADALIGLLGDELKYEVRPVGGPGSPGALFVRGEKFDVQRFYTPPAVPNLPLNGSEFYGLDGNGFLVAERTDGLYTRQVDTGSTSQQMSATEARNLHPKDAATRVAVDNFRADSSHQLRNILSDPNNNYAHKANPKDYDQNILVADLSDSRGINTPMVSMTEIPVGRVLAEYQKSATSSQEQLAQDVAALERRNAAIRRLNSRVLGALRGSTGNDLGADRKAWATWFIAQLGYSYTSTPEGPRPTLVEQVPPAYLPAPVPGVSYAAANGPSVAYRNVDVRLSSKIHQSCFAAGTLVKTFSGLRPIETLRVGDRVLALDPTTGGLAYRPILAVHHNPPSETFRVEAGGDSVVASQIHRFWVAGAGWKMAKDLRPGDTLRTLAGTATVTAVEADKIQPVFNLDVASAKTFYVGRGAALVHDNSVPDLRDLPFDAVPILKPEKAGRPDQSNSASSPRK